MKASVVKMKGGFYLRLIENHLTEGYVTEAYLINDKKMTRLEIWRKKGVILPYLDPPLRIRYKVTKDLPRVYGRLIKMWDEEMWIEVEISEVEIVESPIGQIGLS
jgi:hypothetical protein